MSALKERTRTKHPSQAKGNVQNFKWRHLNVKKFYMTTLPAMFMCISYHEEFNKLKARFQSWLKINFMKFQLPEICSLYEEVENKTIITQINICFKILVIWLTLLIFNFPIDKWVIFCWHTKLSHSRTWSMKEESQGNSEKYFSGKMPYKRIWVWTEVEEFETEW